MPRKVGPSAPRVAAHSIRVLDFRRRNNRFRLVDRRKTNKKTFANSLFDLGPQQPQPASVDRARRPWPRNPRLRRSDRRGNDRRRFPRGAGSNHCTDAENRHSTRGLVAPSLPDRASRNQGRSGPLRRLYLSLRDADDPLSPFARNVRSSITPAGLAVVANAKSISPARSARKASSSSPENAKRTGLRMPVAASLFPTSTSKPKCPSEKKLNLMNRLGTSKNIRSRRDDRRLRSPRCRINGGRPFIEAI